MDQKYFIPGVDAETPLSRAAPAILLAKAEPLFELGAAAAGGEDAEAIHDMRVASRRLREAMRLLSPLYHGPEYRDWYRRVRRITRLLGPVRDSDVFIDDFARLSRDADEGGKRCAAFVIGHRIAQREVEVTVLGRELSRLDLGCRRADFVQMAQAVVTDQASERPLVDFARSAIEDRVQAVVEAQPAATDDRHVLEQHALRIDYKHLRYAVEVFAPCFEDDFDWLHEMLSAFQDTLGELHDMHVFLSTLNDPARVDALTLAGVTPIDIAEMAGLIDDAARDRFDSFMRLAARRSPADIRRALLSPLERGLGT